MLDKPLANSSLLSRAGLSGFPFPATNCSGARGTGPSDGAAPQAVLTLQVQGTPASKEPAQFLQSGPSDKVGQSGSVEHTPA
jgi:hypothetical protein